MHSFQTALRKWSHTEGSMSMAARAELNEYLKRTRERYALPFNVVNKAPISESLVRDPWAHAHSTSSAITFKVWHQCRHITRASYRSCSYYCSCPLASPSFHTLMPRHNQNAADSPPSYSPPSYSPSAHRKTALDSSVSPVARSAQNRVHAADFAM